MQNAIIWGDGWYAIYKEGKEEDEDGSWALAPKKFFDERGFVPDGWEWEIPEGMTSEELDDFIDKYGCEPAIPNEFFYSCESTISSVSENLSFEEQKRILKDFGFIVDNVPAWWYNREKE